MDVSSAYPMVDGGPTVGDLLTQMSLGRVVVQVMVKLQIQEALTHQAGLLLSEELTHKL